MLKLACYTKIIFIDEDNTQRFIYCGHNNAGSLINVLFARFGKTKEAEIKARKAMRSMAEKGYLTPDEANEADDSNRWYWVVEKAIPKKYREDVYGNQMDIEDIKKVLKV